MSDDVRIIFKYKKDEKIHTFRMYVPIEFITFLFYKEGEMNFDDFNLELLSLICSTSMDYIEKKFDYMNVCHEKFDIKSMRTYISLYKNKDLTYENILVVEIKT